jgi:hypothetical protein
MAKIKDTYKIIYNPSRWINKHEVWISGDVQDVLVSNLTGSSTVQSKHSTRHLKSFRTEGAAQAAIAYQEAVARFKGHS